MRVLFITYFIAFIFNIGPSFAQEAVIWKKFTGEINDPEIPLLFDYSYAGYQLGEKGIPENHKGLKVFNVLDFGAIPNDSISDQEAIQAAINAAELNKGGIVFFPPGDFMVNVKPKKTNPIEISSSNIILKGSGMGKNGTVINMKDHMLQRTPDEPEWKVSYMFTFSSKKGEKQRTKITENANEGAFTIVVKNADIFKDTKFIQLQMPYNVTVAKESFEGKKPRPQWEKIQQEGVTFIENHEIKSISGNKITLKDPLINSINTDYNWQAKPFYPLENVGVEDIFFKANFKDTFVHHKDFLHDNAWSMVSMQRVANSWVRRCRFSSVSGAVSVSKSYASSVLMLWVEGNSGHKLTNVTQSTRVLTGLIKDASNNGQFHGASMSHKTSGSVIWRVKTPKQGWDSHADIPINNLVDMYEGSKMTSHGGYYKNEPHHLKGLTLWNYKRVGEPQDNYDFWKLSGPKHLYWGFSVVNPTVVGMHGSRTSFIQENLGYLESLGQAVFPESLYEAQLKYRLGNPPEWIEKYQKEWYKIERELASQKVGQQ
ncbi:Pectate lyase superfamily protein [Arenibacter nanhaiticus]|uniref:Pectate lyase superfamily protein n=1 Tax=Arenibacter nanhaiticus TaxID=558155 RepID=A0A1M6HAM9_9FLAO|nr:DUF4955 domain-containing protein [Arenibacter nanhaiticus]SHJ19134.1 Pectate lyase superfamily protein [Arenibacter nanhaiticus]